MISKSLSVSYYNIVLSVLWDHYSDALSWICSGSRILSVEYICAKLAYQ